MNAKQRKSLVWVAVIIAMMLVYPPYIVKVGNAAVWASGYALITDLPPRATIDIGTLALQWVAVLIVGGISFALAKETQQ